MTTAHRPIVCDVDSLRDVADSRHLRHAIREARRQAVAMECRTVPASLDVIRPEAPAWMRGAPARPVPVSRPWWVRLADAMGVRRG